ncbi:MAG: DUF5320 domain-containing protein [Phycisphaerae bacterium]|nr:DUF5320 domain-containing protein [Phycisphaerae bacterium]
MPAGDGTGPMGMGPMTGRGMGYCVGNTVPGFASPMPGRGLGMGFGRGRGGGRRGWRHQFYATGLPLWARGQAPGVGVPFVAASASVNELEMLRNQTSQLAKTLEQVQQRIAGLESAESKES